MATVEQQERQAARRIAAARNRIAKARRLGPRATVEAVRLSLLSAVRTHPSQEFADEVADFVLAKLRDLYATGGGS